MIEATTPIVSEQIIVLADLSGYHRHICSELTPEKTFAFLSEYYSTVQSALDGSPGRIVKFMGDAILLIFPPHDPTQALAVLRPLKTTVDGWLARGQSSEPRQPAEICLVYCYDRVSTF